jgi:hypothetical protein
MLWFKVEMALLIMPPIIVSNPWSAGTATYGVA